MKNKLKLEQKTGLGHRLMPMQMQYGQMLELAGPEFEETLQAAVDENPALEIVDSDNDKKDYYSSSPTNVTWSRNFSDSSNNVWENMGEENLGTVFEHIMRQVEEVTNNENIILVSKYIAGNIDSNGYITRTQSGISDDIAFQEGKEIPQKEILEAWELVRGCDPAGIAATDLRDCLLLQLQRKKHQSKLEKEAYILLRDHYNLFINRNFDKISDIMSISPEDLKKIIKCISHLNPKPGRQFVSNRDEDHHIMVTPDFIVEPCQVDPSSLTIRNTWEIPDLAVSSTFRIDNEPKNIDFKLSEKEKKKRKEAALFLNQKREEANNFISLVKMRQETLWRIINAIVRIQRDFFLTGDISRLKPMLLKDVAQITGDDLSVISRATSGKYVQTISGIHSIKSLFNEAVDSGEEAVSSRKTEIIIKELIDGEDKTRPLTDDELTKRIIEKGIRIARRTVAKYREKIGMPSAKYRKQL
ncbi:MAG: RNA polymerase factor sigma-54 [Muribaculaceae bacterium]|nr:RNA polymerase factor sigma-54 [Muribaculaceae bacterium]